MQVTIYHNPACGTSRNTLALIRHFGITPVVIDYQKTPPSRGRLAAILATAGISPRRTLRIKGTPYAELGLDGASDDALLEAMVAHPILINRPLVVTDTAAALCRPSDIVLDLLPDSAVADMPKEDGTPFLRCGRVEAGDAGLVAALMAANLPVDDLAEPGRCFFAFRNLGGETVGYGGYEPYGSDVLLRSIVVLPAGRSKGIGRAMVPVLLQHAWRDGAQKGWLLTISAADFFERNGFARSARDDAPATILQTRQAQSLCPASAVLLCKNIRF